MAVQLVSTGRRCERRARFVDYHRTRSRDLRDRLVRRHLPLARRLAYRFARRGIPIDDLYQVASIGLIHAVERFDPTRGVPFDVFASPTILGEIRHHFRDRSWDLRVPRRLQNLHLAVEATVEQLRVRLCRAPTVAELARAIGVGEEEIVEAIEAGAVYNTAPLAEDRPEDRPGPPDAPDDPLRVEDPWLTAAVDRLLIATVIDELAPRRRLIVRLYFWEGLSQDAIAERLGLSQMHVSRLLRASLAQLRGLLEDDE